MQELHEIVQPLVGRYNRYSEDDMLRNWASHFLGLLFCSLVRTP